MRVPRRFITEENRKVAIKTFRTRSRLWWLSKTGPRLQRLNCWICLSDDMRSACVILTGGGTTPGCARFPCANLQHANSYFDAIFPMTSKARFSRPVSIAMRALLDALICIEGIAPSYTYALTCMSFMVRWSSNSAS